MARTADPAAVYRQVLASGKYRHLHEDFARRVAGEAAARFRDQNDAVRYAKRKLHQAFGAFLSGSPGDAVRACVDAVRSGVPAREACLAAMRTHASTAERVPSLDAFYRQVADWCPGPRSVVDLACGLNPLALPWLAIGPDATYWCCDVDRDLMAAVAGLGEVFEVEVRAEPGDLLAPAAVPPADLALLLKTLTTLEQQRAGATGAVLAALDAPQVVLTLPRSSLSAHRRYGEDPAGQLAKATAGTGYQLADRVALGDELVCLLARAPS